MDLIQWTQNTAIRKYPESRELALPEHIAIMDAVCARDAAQASRAMRAHLENAYLRMADRFEAAQEASSGARRPMKVKSVSSHILRAPLGAQKFYSSQAAFPERNSYLVRVETDSVSSAGEKAASMVRRSRSPPASTLFLRRGSSGETRPSP